MVNEYIVQNEQHIINKNPKAGSKVMQKTKKKHFWLEKNKIPELKDQMTLEMLKI